MQARQTLEVEAAPLLAPVSNGKEGRRLPPGGHDSEEIDWAATSLLFLFPALGGALFGCEEPRNAAGVLCAGLLLLG